MEKLLVITGPTASGKSSLALELAQVYPIEIISADSMQVYRYMDIGTDKVSKEIREQIPHHLIDIKYPDEPWSVEEFQERAKAAIEDIQSRDR
ncbi:MAG TPA: isopentenyl transferase family protein, partial [Bacillota bacterium]|nr:isopentenyl transferase family protein [Bacillota bacterium]